MRIAGVEDRRELGDHHCWALTRAGQACGKRRSAGVLIDTRDGTVLESARPLDRQRATAAKVPVCGTHFDVAVREREERARKRLDRIRAAHVAGEHRELTKGCGLCRDARKTELLGPRWRQIETIASLVDDHFQRSRRVIEYLRSHESYPGLLYVMDHFGGHAEELAAAEFSLEYLRTIGSTEPVRLSLMGRIASAPQPEGFNWEQALHATVDRLAGHLVEGEWDQGYSLGNHGFGAAVASARRKAASHWVRTFRREGAPLEVS